MSALIFGTQRIVKDLSFAVLWVEGYTKKSNKVGNGRMREVHREWVKEGLVENEEYWRGVLKDFKNIIAENTREGLAERKGRVGLGMFTMALGNGENHTVLGKQGREKKMYLT